MDPQELRRPQNMFTLGKIVAELVHSMLSATVREFLPYNRYKAHHPPSS